MKKAGDSEAKRRKQPELKTKKKKEISKPKIGMAMLKIQKRITKEPTILKSIETVSQK